MKKPDLLLLHGAIATKDQFDSLIPLLEADFDCHSLNFSGHGNEATDKPFGIAQFAQDVINWMDDNNHQTINIFGYSMGGYVAMYLAFHYPKKIGKIFTLATKFDWTPENALAETKLLNPQKIEEKIPAFAQMLNAKHQDWKAVLNNTAQMMIQMGNVPLLLSKEFSNIKHEVIISVGDEDSTATAEAAQEVHSTLLNSQLLILFDTPHPFERVDLSILSQHLISFFSE